MHRRMHKAYRTRVVLSREQVYSMNDMTPGVSVKVGTETNEMVPSGVAGEEGHRISIRQTELLAKVVEYAKKTITGNPGGGARPCQLLRGTL